MHCTVQKALPKTKIINAFFKIFIIKKKKRIKKNKKTTDFHQVGEIAYVPGMPGMSLLSHLPGGTTMSHVNR